MRSSLTCEGLILSNMALRCFSSVMNKLYRLQGRVRTSRHLSATDSEELSSLLADNRFADREIISALYSLNAGTREISEYPRIWEHIQRQYTVNRELYKDKTMISLLWTLKRKRSNNEEFLRNLYNDIGAVIGKLNANLLCMCVEALSYRVKYLNSDLVEQLHRKIIELEGSFQCSDFTQLMANLRYIHVESMKEIKVYDSLEREMIRLKAKLSLRAVGTALTAFTRVYYRRSSSVFEIMQGEIISRLHEVKETATIPIILNAYCQTRTVHDFSSLFKACVIPIRSNFSSYAAKINDLVTLVHTYSKIGQFPEIMSLLEEFIVELPQELIKAPASLGVFLYSVLRHPPSFEYEKKTVGWLYLYKEIVPTIHQKKILIVMIQRNSDCEIYWKNIGKLNIIFTSLDQMLIGAYTEEIIKRNVKILIDN